MKMYFVYSSGGGAGDWNGINRIFQQSMPAYFKDNILLKFGDIFFNHRSEPSVIKPVMWRRVSDAKTWLIGKTNDNSIRNYEGMILDVGTTKIVSYITFNEGDIPGMQLIARFERILQDENILDKYCDFILASDIKYAVTFDIPNLFKVRSRGADVSRNLFSEGNCKSELIDACANFANHTYHRLGDSDERLLTIVNLAWEQRDIETYFSKLDYRPTKLAVGGAAFYRRSEMGDALQRMNSVIDFSSFERVHFLGCGGLEPAGIIKDTLGNLCSFSVDNTTPYNRAIDGSTSGAKQSGYYDYFSGRLIRISPATKTNILNLHQRACDAHIAYFSHAEMETIINGILQHQNQHSCSDTYNCRAKLVIHNFDVFRYHAN